jgi:hypothetical protein
LSEGVVIERQMSAFESWPRYVVGDQPGREAVRLEGAAIKYAIISVDLGDQPVLDAAPVRPQELQRRHVDRNTGELDHGGGGHVAPPADRPRKVDAWQHGRQQPP